MSRSNDEYYGHAVVNGVPQFYSVSALERGDIRSGGCLLKWHKRYVQGLKDKDSDSKTAGNAMHSELETYYKAGPDAPIMLSAMAMRALPYLPDRGPDILSEAKLSSPRAPFLFADGVPLIVKVDLLHDRGTNKGAESPEEMYDPPGTVEVLDFKWKKNASVRSQEFHLQPSELVKSIQMSGYGVAVGNVWPEREHVRLSHLYIPATGIPRKVTRLHVIDDCRRNWEYVESVGRTLRDVAKETNERNVQGNRHACEKYGGCDHKATCYAYARNVEQYTTSQLFGETAAKELTMGLLNTLPPDLTQTVQAAQPQSLLGQLPPQPDMRAQLAAEEAAQRAQAAQTSVGTYPGFAEAWATIERAGQGTPALAGLAAQLKAAMGGYAITPGAGLPGAGRLAGLTIQDPSHIIQLAGELANNGQVPAVQQPAPVQHVQHNAQAPMQSTFLPPNAPQSNPALAAKPVEGFSLPTQPVMLQPPQMQQVAMQVPLSNGVPQLVPTTNVSAAPVEAPKKKRGRKSNAEKAASAQPIQAIDATTGQPVTIDPDVFDSDSAVYINCIPNGEFESLKPYVDQICEALIKKFGSADPQALRDVRMAPKDGPLGFGAWPGAIRALVIECPPPGGLYYLDTRDSDLSRPVADGLETVCNRVGALCVKGI